MADGPRCQRRKQAKPRRNNVRSFSNVSEAASDSDDEDKLHIVEEDSIPDTPEEKLSVFQLSATQQRYNRHKQDDGNLGPDAMIQEIRVKEECVTDEEGQTNETTQNGGKGSIYSEEPNKDESTPERGVHDENGTPDEFSQLHTCPYCSRGYKRHTSLKEHIKLRHEKSEDDFSCSLCSYTFTYRTQLDRHMTAHKSGKEQRTVSQAGGNRKFKCTECSKAFKYKHHLKEHLRIHSGEKPYECSNCKKRFSHSGSYSSHISSKKCVATPPAGNSLSRIPGVKAALTLTRPTRILLREKVDIDNKPLQEQLPPKQIKQEPVEHELKPVKLTPVVSTTNTTSSTSTTTNNTTTTNNNNGCAIPIQTAIPQGVVQTLVVPTVGLVQPISINLSDLQNVLKAAMDGNVVRQVVASTNASGASTKVVNQVQPQAQAVVMQATQPQAQVISAISLPVLDQDGNTKFIINYNVDPKTSTSKMNTTPSTESTTQGKVLEANVAAPKLVQVNSTQPPKVVQVGITESPKVVPIKSAQPNVTPTQMPTITKPGPPQVNILKPAPTAAPSKAPSIIKVTKLVPAQTKNTQPTLLLLRTADGSQSLVVRQLAAINSNTQVTPTLVSKITEQKSNPEKSITETEQSPRVELNQTAEETSQLEDLSTKLLDGVHIKTEPRSPAQTDSEMQTESEDHLHEERQKEREEEGIIAKNCSTTVHSSVACGDGFHNYATCLFCDNSPSSIDILNLLNSDEQGPGRSLFSLLGEDDDNPPVKSLLPLLKAYSKDSQPSKEQLSRIAESVGLPLDVVSRWFQKMHSKKISLQLPANAKKPQKTLSNSQPESCLDTQPHNTPKETHDVTSLDQNSDLSSPLNLSTNDLVIVKTEEPEEEQEEDEGQAEPLDLSLPKSSPCDGNASVTMLTPATKPPVPAQEEPLNLTCFKKNTLPGNTIYVAQSSTGPINIIATPLPTLVAIAEPGGIPHLGAAMSTKQRTILIPQLSYTYAAPSTNSKTNDNISANNKANTVTTPADSQGTVVLNGCQDKADAGGESVSEWEGLSDSNLSPNRKRRKIQGGQYACDLCDKIFQKSSSLLRHKYEHTGKRPHECGVCKKAFKHKHHLIEHSRLHSGEKPYQCDKCGKRFSHSGSYSQHMNHRYSYCKKDGHEQSETNPASATPSSQLDSDERESEAEEEEEDDEEHEGERDGEDGADFADFDMSDIRVVRIGEDYDDDEEEEEEERGEEEAAVEEETVVMQTEKIHFLDDVMETADTDDIADNTADKETGNPVENGDVTDENPGMNTEEGNND